MYHRRQTKKLCIEFASWVEKQMVKAITHLFSNPLPSFLVAVDVNACPGRKFLRLWMFWVGVPCWGSQDTELEAGLPKSKTKFPCIAEPTYRNAGLLLWPFSRSEQNIRRDSAVSDGCPVSAADKGCLGNKEGKFGGLPLVHPPAFGRLWFRAFFDLQVAPGSLCLTANIESNLCDYIQFSLVFTSIFSLFEILRLGVSQHCYTLIKIRGGKRISILDMVTDNLSFIFELWEFANNCSLPTFPIPFLTLYYSSSSL